MEYSEEDGNDASETLIEQARAAIGADDGETALDVLEVIVEGLTENSWAGFLPHDSTW